MTNRTSVGSVVFQTPHKVEEDTLEHHCFSNVEQSEQGKIKIQDNYSWVILHLGHIY